MCARDDDCVHPSPDHSHSRHKANMCVCFNSTYADTLTQELEGNLKIELRRFAAPISLSGSRYLNERKLKCGSWNRGHLNNELYAA